MLSNAFLLNLKHRSFIETGNGKLQSTLWNGAWLFAGILLLGIGLLRIDMTTDSINDWRILEERGVVETFTVRGVTEDSTFWGTEYRVTFGENSATGSFTSTQTTSDYTPTFSATGQETVRVIYDPQTFQPDGAPAFIGSPRMAIESGFGFPLFEVTITTVFVLVGMGMSLYGLYRMVNYLRLQREGELVPGEIIEVVKIRADKGVNFAIQYAFESPETGEIIEGRAKHRRRQPEKRPVPRKGAPVAVLYRNDHEFEVL